MEEKKEEFEDLITFTAEDYFQKKETDNIVYGDPFEFRADIPINVTYEKDVPFIDMS